MTRSPLRTALRWTAAAVLLAGGVALSGGTAAAAGCGGHVALFGGVDDGHVRLPGDPFDLPEVPACTGPHCSATPAPVPPPFTAPPVKVAPAAKDSVLNTAALAAATGSLGSFHIPVDDGAPIRRSATPFHPPRVGV